MIPKVTFRVRTGDEVETDGGCAIGGQWINKTTDDFFKGKRVVLFSLPGAFTPTCSTQQLPKYEELYDEFIDLGIEDVYCTSVNDPFVMNAWGKENNVGDKIIMMGDPFLNFTKAIGAEVDKSGRGLGIRSNRYTMLVDNLKIVKIQEEKDTGSCEISAAENFLELI